MAKRAKRTAFHVLLAGPRVDHYWIAADWQRKLGEYPLPLEMTVSTPSELISTGWVRPYHYKRSSDCKQATIRIEPGSKVEILQVERPDCGSIQQPGVFGWTYPLFLATIRYTPAGKISYVP